MALVVRERLRRYIEMRLRPGCLSVRLCVRFEHLLQKLVGDVLHALFVSDRQDGLVLTTESIGQCIATFFATRATKLVIPTELLMDPPKTPLLRVLHGRMYRHLVYTHTRLEWSTCKSLREEHLCLIERGCVLPVLQTCLDGCIQVQRRCMKQRARSVQMPEAVLLDVIKCLGLDLTPSPSTTTPAPPPICL